jgi:hypothetical protein
MRRLLVVAGMFVLALATIAAAQGRGTASLRLVRAQPLVVGGSGFRSLEHVRVRLVLRESTYTRRVVATRTGALVVSFAAVPISRCEAIQVVAVGNRGSRAELKRAPPPACMPA